MSKTYSGKSIGEQASYINKVIVLPETNWLSTDLCTYYF